jgi:Tol biopolymer transport system component
VTWFDNRGEEELVGLSFPLPQFDTDHRLMIDDTVAPIWEPEGRSLLIPHNDGIERITLSGDRAALVGGVVVTAIALSPDGQDVVYSTGYNIHAFGRGGGAPEMLLPPDFVPAFGNRIIRAMASSPEGDRLAFSVGHEMFVMDTQSRSVEKIFEAANGIYWMSWVPESERIVFTSGKEDLRNMFYSPWVRDPQGKCRLMSITSRGKSARTLFSQRFIDVRQAVPNLSPDGRYVSLTAKPGSTREVVVVATDGSGITYLTTYGPNTHASWRPLP